MMIGTSFGIFYPTLRKPETIPAGDYRNVQIRARRLRDLMMLRELHMPQLTDPIMMNDADYQFRAYCSSTELATGLASLALEMDYTAFKHTPEIKYGDKALLHVYEGIWGVHLRAFPTGSKFDFKPTRRRQPLFRNVRPTDENPNGRVYDETVVRRGGKDWVMAGSNPEQLAALMREIDNATADVVLPSDDELRAVDAYERARVSLEPLLTGPTELNGHLDHSQCDHNSTPSARRKCRKRFYGRF